MALLNRLAVTVLLARVGGIVVRVRWPARRAPKMAEPNINGGDTATIGLLLLLVVVVTAVVRIVGTLYLRSKDCFSIVLGTMAAGNIDGSTVAIGLSSKTSL